MSSQNKIKSQLAWCERLNWTVPKQTTIHICDWILFLLLIVDNTPIFNFY